MRFFNLLFFLLLLSIRTTYAQDDLSALLDEQMEEETVLTNATFKSTRVMNGHSIERMPAGQLDFRISHRFGRINSGAYDLWGLDQANIHFGLDLGLTNWLMIGVGRGTYEKTYDGLLKLSILRQASGKRTMPVSLSYLATTSINSLKWSNPDRTNYFTSRLAYAHQILIARKFNEWFSFQLSPVYIHKNLVPTALDPNDSWAIGAGGRLKITRRFAFNAEYFYVIPPINDFRSMETYNPLSLGFDIETGGHVFQIMCTNSLAMIEKGFITETTGRWDKGDIHLGFNISRVFQVRSNVRAGNW